MTGSDQERRVARARRAAALVWALGAALATALFLALADGSPEGKALGVAGGVLVVAVLDALVLVGVNSALAADPERHDMAGAADLATYASVLLPVLALGLGLWLARPYHLLLPFLAVLVLVLHAGLFAIALWTRTAARRAEVGARPRPPARRTAA